MGRFRNTAIASGLIFLFACSNTLATTYSLTDLGPGNAVTGINNFGQVVGNNGNGPFIWSAGLGLRGLGELPQDSDPGISGGTIVAGSASSINDNGYVAGTVFTNNGLSEPFVWTPTYGYRLLEPGSRNAGARALNNAGDVVGSTRNHANKWPSGGGSVSLPSGVWNSWANAINDAGVAVGYFVYDSRSAPSFWAPSGVSYPDFGSNNFRITPRDINNGNLVVGSYQTEIGPGSGGGAGGPERAFLSSTAGRIDLGTLGGTSSQATSINNVGVIVGGANLAGDAAASAFVYKNGAMSDLNTRLDSSGAGWSLTGAIGISDGGQIIGNGTYNGQSRAFLLTPAPGLQPPTGSAPDQPTYTEPSVPTPAVAIKNLVLVTHGRVDKADTLDSWPWQMALAIAKRLAPNGQPVYVPGPNLGYYQAGDSIVAAFNWEAKADSSILKVKGNAEEVGRALGASLIGKGYGNIETVHLIAHSAGSALINEAARVLNPDGAGGSGPRVQTTFLDPYAGFLLGGSEAYGSKSDWSDNYFSRDPATNIFTQQQFPQAHNVDVTPDTNQFSAHGWPVDFYQQTVAGSTDFARGYGYGLNMEEGNWTASQLNSTYKKGNVPVAFRDDTRSDDAFDVAAQLDGELRSPSDKSGATADQSNWNGRACGKDAAINGV